MQGKTIGMFMGFTLVAQVYADDGCHNKNDIIGKACAFNPNTDAFMDAATVYCDMFNNTNEIRVPVGDSYGIKFYRPDGYGGIQIFWGNYRVDKGDDGTNVHLITRDSCLSDMTDIFSRCGGQGGWHNTHSGTTFGECIKR